jgi:hypothetical protein
MVSVCYEVFWGILETPSTSIMTWWLTQLYVVFIHSSSQNMVSHLSIHSSGSTGHSLVSHPTQSILFNPDKSDVGYHCSSIPPSYAGPTSSQYVDSKLKVNFVSLSKISERGSLQNAGYQHHYHKMDNCQFMKYFLNCIHKL